MAVAKWAAPSTATTLTLSGVNSLANGAASGLMSFDNSTARDLYANVRVALGSLTPTTGGSITVVVFSDHGATVPDNTAAVGGGDRYTAALTTTTGVKEVVVPMVRLYPETLRFALVNNAGVALAASGNVIAVRPYNEDVT